MKFNKKFFNSKTFIIIMLLVFIIAFFLDPKDVCISSTPFYCMLCSVILYLIIDNVIPIELLLLNFIVKKQSQGFSALMLLFNTIIWIFTTLNNSYISENGVVLFPGEAMFLISVSFLCVVKSFVLLKSKKLAISMLCLGSCIGILLVSHIKEIFT